MLLILLNYYLIDYKFKNYFSNWYKILYIKYYESNWNIKIDKINRKIIIKIIIIIFNNYNNKFSKIYYIHIQVILYVTCTYICICKLT